jgi:hypothetical protein
MEIRIPLHFTLYLRAVLDIDWPLEMPFKSNYCLYNVDFLENTLYKYKIMTAIIFLTERQYCNLSA